MLAIENHTNAQQPTPLTLNDMSYHGLSSTRTQYQTQPIKPCIHPNAIVRYFTLQKGQCLEIPRELSILNVFSGIAWVIVEQRDIVMSEGQERLLPIAKYPTVVTVLGDRPVSLAIRCHRCPPMI